MALMDRFAIVSEGLDMNTLHVTVIKNSSNPTRAEHTFTKFEEVPTWIREKVAILDFCDVVEGVGHKVKTRFDPDGYTYFIEER